MSQYVRIARQAIVGSNKKLYGFEMLYRSDKDPENRTELNLDYKTATSKVLVAMLNQIGLNRSVGQYKAFINIDESILLTNLLGTLPAERFVFELPSTIKLTNKEIENIKMLRGKGYVFAIDKVILSDEFMRDFSKILPYITYLKIEVIKNDFEYVSAHIDRLKEEFILIAEKVEDEEYYDAYRDLGFNYFQGHYLSEPTLLKQYRLEPKHIGITRLYKMLQSDSTIGDIATEFEHYSELSIQLLQYLHSITDKKIKKANSIRDIVKSAGKDRLLNWIILLVYAKSNQDVATEKSAHSFFLNRRINIMNAIMDNIDPDKEGMKRQIDLVALLSTLMDVFQVTFDELEESFDFNDLLELALASRLGPFGKIYNIATEIEKSEFADDDIDRLVKNYNTDIEKIQHSLKQHA